MSARPPGALLLVLSLIVVGIGSATAALAQQSPTAKSITFVARTCPQYTDVMANKARNNLQESLRDLGPDSTYADNSTVTPAQENAGSPNCAPLPGWTFSTGSSHTQHDPDIEHYLSTVTGAFRQNIVTGPDGQVTVNLTDAEARLVERGESLWVQGGTPDNPLNENTPVNPGGSVYGFGALRCAQDAVNGDNVEQVTYPAGSNHVYCYYYAISPPPTAGEITVRKEVAPGSPGTGTFPFSGNISYNEDHDFALTASANEPSEQTFVRAATGDGPPWTFRELQLDGWSPPGPARCTSETGASAIDQAGPETSVHLAAGDHVICTYSNARTIDDATLQKESVGGVGDFDFHIRRPDGSVREESVSTTEESVPVVVADAEGAIPGDYEVTETFPPATEAGHWELAAANCNGVDLPVTNTPTQGSATITMQPGVEVRCLFSNRYVPDGSITIDKTSHGGVSTFQYQIKETEETPTPGISPVLDALSAEATTTQEGVPVTAVPVGPPATGILVDPAKRFTVQELLPAEGPAGTWRMVSADCGPNQLSVDPASASVDIVLDSSRPHARCHFVNRLVRPGTVEIAKSTTADTTQRPDPVLVDYTCGGVAGRLEVAPGLPAGEVAASSSNDPVRCSVSEPQTGAAEGVAVTTGAQLIVDGQARPYAFGEPFTVEPGQQVRLAIDNAYAPPPPGPTPPPEPGPTPPPEPTEPPGPTEPAPAPGEDGAGPGPGEPGDEQQDLAQTGAPDALRALGGLGLLTALTGAVLAVSARRRS